MKVHFGMQQLVEQQVLTMRRTKHFNPDVDTKMRCTCCKTGQLSVATLILLEVVRAHFKAPVNITSGPRCTKHNKDCGGAKNSQHLITSNLQDVTAVDIRVQGVEHKVVYNFLVQLPYANLLGVGSYNTFTHVDTRGTKARW